MRGHYNDKMVEGGVPTLVRVECDKSERQECWFVCVCFYIVFPTFNCLRASLVALQSINYDDNYDDNSQRS